MPMNGRFTERRKDTIQCRLHGIVLEMLVFKVTAPEVFDNSAFCMMLVPSTVYMVDKDRLGFLFLQAQKVSKIAGKQTGNLYAWPKQAQPSDMTSH